MIKRMALGIEYNGSSWRGWQKQPDGQTVQDQLERALTQFTQTPITTLCAGRTDAGVHALEQVVHFDTTIDRPDLAWVRGVNAWLPKSIAVRWAVSVPRGQDGFHARASAWARRYQYILYNDRVRSPLWHQRAGWEFRPLDGDQMRLAASYLLGEHDFSAFRAAQCQAITPIKTMHRIEIVQEGAFFIFSFEANAFLHHMVRNIVGSLVYVGKGDYSPQWMKEVLMSKDRRKAAPTFMPDGLYLAKVIYDPKWQLPQQQTELSLLGLSTVSRNPA